jgi:hypothetical protein
MRNTQQDAEVKISNLVRESSRTSSHKSSNFLQFKYTAILCHLDIIPKNISEITTFSALDRQILLNRERTEDARVISFRSRTNRIARPTEKVLLCLSRCWVLFTGMEFGAGGLHFRRMKHTQRHRGLRLTDPIGQGPP